MINWNLLSPPKLAALALALGVPLTLLYTLHSLRWEQSTLLEWEILHLRDLSFYVPLLLDKYSIVFGVTVITISLSVIIFRVRYISGDKDLEYFIYIVILFVISILTLIFIPNLLILLLGWDGLGLTSYLLVIYYQRDKSLAAGIITAITNRVGDSLLILAGAWSITQRNWNTFLTRTGMIWIVSTVVIVGATTKRAQLPFSAWLPAAIAAPTPVSSLVHSSTLVTAGVYLLFRFYERLTLFTHFSTFIFYSGTITCLIAGLSATSEYDFKKVIALSTLRQLGVIIIALGLSLPLLAFFHLIAHALFKALLFICAGNIIHSKQNNQDLRLIGDIWVSIPATCGAFNVANIALCGLPFTAGFYSKDIIVERFIYNLQSVIRRALFIRRICLTSLYSARLRVFTLWSPFKRVSLRNTGDERVWIYIPSLILLLGAVIGGAGLMWALVPTVVPICIPPLLKVSTFLLIIALGLLGYLITINSTHLPLIHFIRSIWFLTFISSSPASGSVINLSKTFIKHERTWMEYLRGKGVFRFIRSTSHKLQLSQGLSFSRLYSLLAIVIIIGARLTL